MCLTYIETNHRLCAKSLIVNYSLLEVFILANKKYFIIFGSLCINILFGRGGGIFFVQTKRWIPLLFIY